MRTKTFQDGERFGCRFGLAMHAFYSRGYSMPHFGLSSDSQLFGEIFRKSCRSALTVDIHGGTLSLSE